MKLRTSFFNPTVLRKDIARFFPLWGLLLIFKLLAMSLTVDDSAYLAMEVVNSMQTVGILQFFYGGFCALLLFGDLFKTRSANTLHALPLRREGWFFTHLTAGVILYLLPHVPEALLCGLLLWDFWYLAVLRLLIGLVMFLFFFGVGAFSCQCAGNRLGALAVYMLTNFFSLVILFLLETFYRPLLPGVILSNRLALYLCPIVAFSNGKFVVAESYYDIGRWKFQFQGFVGGDWLQLLIAFGFALVVLGCALLLYRRRHMETAGDFIAVRFVAPVFLVLYSFAIGAIVYLIGDNSYLFMMVGVAIGFFTGLMLLHKKVNVFQKKAWLSLGIFLVAFLATLGITKLDPFGVVSYVPAASEVESVTIGTDYYSPYSLSSGTDFETQVVLDTPEELEALEKLHLQCLQEKNDYARMVQLSYRLKNGRVVKRQYSYSARTAVSQQLRPLLSRLDLFEDTQKLENTISITYENDLDSATIPNVQIFSRPLTTEAFDSGMNIKHTTETTLDRDSMATGLWEAIRKDCLEGKMAQDWEYHSQRSGWLIVTYRDENGKISTQEINIYTDATHTIEYLESLIS